MADLLPTTPQFAVETWNTLRDDKRRTVNALNKRLAELGFQPVARSSFHRWNGTAKTDPAAMIPTNIKPERVSPALAKEAAPLAPKVITDEHRATLDLSGVPAEFVDALGARLLLVAKGEGLDKVEDAIVRVATAIAGKADDIAAQLLATERETEETERDGETVKKKTVEAANAARNAVQALGTLAEAMHRIVAARTLFSVASRNFSEGDRLSGEGAKFRAEAETLRINSRADGARTINGRPGDGGFSDAEAEDEALSALRDVESR